jgi:4,5-dihydroxyphthalate decarboxylase
LLEHEYGVPLDSITWVVAIDVPLRPQVRSRLKIQTLPPGRTLIDLLACNEIDAIIEASDPTANYPGPVTVRPLLGHDTRQMEVDYYSRTGIFPIMHTIVLWSEIAQRFPALPEALHGAFVEAKKIGGEEPDYPERYLLAEEERRWWTSLTHDQKKIMHGHQDPPRDPWIYSAQIDRKAIETFLDYAYEQGLTSVRDTIENLFVPSTLKA